MQLGLGPFIKCFMETALLGSAGAYKSMIEGKSNMVKFQIQIPGSVDSYLQGRQHFLLFNKIFIINLYKFIQIGTHGFIYLFSYHSNQRCPE